MCVCVYLWQLSIVLVELGKVDPEGVWLTHRLTHVHRLHCLRVRVDDLRRRAEDKYVVTVYTHSYPELLSHT